MIKRPQLYLLIYYFLIFSFLPSIRPGEAGEIGEIGESGLLASIFVKKTYDDNIFLTRQDKKSDRITDVVPSLSLAKTKKNIYLNLHYGAHLMYYDDYSQENQYSQAGTWDIGGHPGAKSKIGIRGSDNYSYIKIDEREPLVADNTNKQNDFTVTPYLEKGFGKRINSFFSYTYSERVLGSTKKEDVNLENSENQTGIANFSYALSKRTSIEGEYRCFFADFAKETPDYSEQQVGGGLTLELMKSKVKMHGRVGHVWRKVEKLSPEKGESDQKDGYESIDSKIDISLLKETLITAGYTQSSSYQSTHDPNNDFYISHNVTLNIQHKLLHQRVTATYGVVYNFLDYESPEKMDRSYLGTARIDWKLFRPILLSLNGDWGISHYTYNLTDRRDRSSGGGAGLTWKIFQPMTLFLQGNYTRFDYDPDDRQDELYDESCTLSYAIRRNIFFEIGHRYLENKSVDKKLQRQGLESDGEEYVNHKYSIGLKAVF
jgi:hypothetical protein